MYIPSMACLAAATVRHMMSSGKAVHRFIRAACTQQSNYWLAACDLGFRFSRFVDEVGARVECP
jgi:hypothetical protein